jgi:hypothetical protein
MMINYSMNVVLCLIISFKIMICKSTKDTASMKIVMTDDARVPLGCLLK